MPEGGTAGETHEEIDIEVPATAELAVRDLEGHGHLVAFVQLFVEAFARVGAHLDVVRQGGGEEGGKEGAGGEGEEMHRW